MVTAAIGGRHRDTIEHVENRDQKKKKQTKQIR